MEYVLIVLIKLNLPNSWTMKEVQLELTREECSVLAEKINTSSESQRVAACIPMLNSY